MNIRILPNLLVGAYRIRPEVIHLDKYIPSGGCAKPQHGMFVDIHFIKTSLAKEC